LTQAPRGRNKKAERQTRNAKKLILEGAPYTLPSAQARVAVEVVMAVQSGLLDLDLVDFYIE